MSSHNNSPFSFLIFAAAVLVMLASTAPFANATIFGSISSLTVTGQVCCTATGNCGSPPLPGGTAQLICNILFGQVNVGLPATISGGSFTITVPGGPLVPYRLVPYIGCFVRIGLPVAGCTTVTTGAYVSSILAVSPLLSPTKVATAGGFVAVP